MKTALIGVGGLAVITGLAGPSLLPSLPSSIQTNASLQSAGIFIIDNGTWIAIFGAILLIVAFIWA
jgi:hypothetical protein